MGAPVDAGWVPCVIGASGSPYAVPPRRRTRGRHRVVAPRSARSRRRTSPSSAPDAQRQGVVAAFLARISDYQANLLAQRYLDREEIETYIRHNIRTLRFTYAPPQLFRMLIRYLFELQYLGFSGVADAKTFLVRSTWFDADFFATGMLDPRRFVELAEAAAMLCGCWAVDESRFSAKQ
jgi:hypothetical protein